MFQAFFQPFSECPYTNPGIFSSRFNFKPAHCFLALLDTNYDYLLSIIDINSSNEISYLLPLDDQMNLLPDIRNDPRLFP